jgi:cytochrome c-type biogenesis protein CcmH/NrfF
MENRKAKVGQGLLEPEVGSRGRGARFRFFLGVSLVLLALTLPADGILLLADQSDRAHQIGAKLKCTCGGCDQAAGKCYHVGGTYSGPCDTAKTMLKEIDSHIASGMNDDQVLKAMIQEYGPLAYVEPPKTGFGLVAWLMPVVYLLGGTALVVVVMKRWRKRPLKPRAELAGNGTRVSPELLARAREQARRETEE